jgi:hypothetical protein
VRRDALAVLSSGLPLPHPVFGNKMLLDLAGCDLSRAAAGHVPVMDAHRPELLGHVRAAWVEHGRLLGELRFDNTRAGRAAFERLPNGVSIGTDNIRSDDISVVDAFGREHDFDVREWLTYHQDPSLILHARCWELLEVSMTESPADHGAIARPINRAARRIRRRMAEAQRHISDRTLLLADPILERALDTRSVRFAAEGSLL